MSFLSSDLLRTFPVSRPSAPNRFGLADLRSLPRLLAGSSWFVGTGSLLIDALCWVGIFYVFSVLRQGVGTGNVDGFPISVCGIQCASTLLCLYLVGGYDRRTNFLSLNYMSEHCITLLAAGALGALVIYVCRAFGQIGIVSSSVLLGSQLAFMPLSLVCRRSLRQMIQTQLGRTYFLVLGTGEAARQLHHSNRHLEHDVHQHQRKQRLHHRRR